ncbi:hypothetical protein JHK86_047853 [Glycine max]|nr:hypothetical protein JHK86_047853 [Glycine max]
MHSKAEALEHTKKRDTGHQSVSLENKTGDSIVLKIGNLAKVVIKQDMKGRKHKYGFNNNKREKTEKKRVVDDETGDKHQLDEVLRMPYQPTNCRYIYKEWEIGIEIDTNVKREEVEKLVNDFTEGEKGNKMRKKIVELKKKAGEATTPSGCSFMNLDKFIKERNLMYLAAIVDSQPQPSPLPGQVHHTVGDITTTAFLSASTVVRHAQPTRDKLQWKSRPPHAAK